MSGAERSDRRLEHPSARAATPLHTRVPPPPLSRFVDFLWAHDGERPAHARERILPSGTTELVISLAEHSPHVSDGLGGDPLADLGGAMVCGPHASFFAIDAAVQVPTIGVHFRPGGALPFFDPRADELRDRLVPLEALWGRAARRLREELVDAPNAAERLCILERHLLARAARPLVWHPVVACALAEFARVPGSRGVGELAKDLGSSPRHFIELFERATGLTPKLFCRVRRFQEALRLVGSRTNVAWADIALACGYFDQSHLVRDFRAFSGTTPTAYLDDRGAHANHLVLRE